MPIKMPGRAPATKVSEEQDPREEFADYRAALLIDKNDLDEAMVRQPVLYSEVSEAQVLAAAQRDTAKQRLEATDARLADNIRRAWSKEGERFAEARVGDAVLQEAEHVAALAEYSRCARRASYLGSLVSSFEQRGKMLRELAGLFMSGYFSRSVSSRGKQDLDAAQAAVGREGMRRARMTRNEDR